MIERERGERRRGGKGEIRRRRTHDRKQEKEREGKRETTGNKTDEKKT